MRPRAAGKGSTGKLSFSILLFLPCPNHFTGKIRFEKHIKDHLKRKRLQKEQYASWKAKRMGEIIPASFPCKMSDKIKLYIYVYRFLYVLQSKWSLLLSSQSLSSPKPLGSGDHWFTLSPNECESCHQSFAKV